MNLRNHPNICWTISEIVSYVHLKNFNGIRSMTSAMPVQLVGALHLRRKIIS